MKDYPYLSTPKGTTFFRDMQGKIEVFSDKMQLSIDKYRGFIDKNGHPAGHPSGSLANQGGAKTMKNTLAGDVGAAMSPPRGQRGRAPSAYVVIFVLSFISLDIL